MGIVGLGGSTVDAAELTQRTDAIRHRGPDDSGFWTGDSVGLGFRRLAILDLTSAGHQPMLSPDRRYVMVFNGEIYNFAELREELAALGHRFTSSGDSDVLLHAYMQWGKSCVTRLNGMWAFLIYDTQRRVLFGSRDRLGIKPLYMRRTPSSLMFGSEIKALQGGEQALTPSWNRVADWLLSGSVDAVDVRRGTFLEQIEEIEAATAFEVTPDGALTKWAYWSLDEAQPVDPSTAVERFGELFDDAMTLQSRADVPVGVSLSGGLDSTSILCGLSRLRGADTDPIVALCFMSEEHDERQYIEATLNATNSVMQQVDVQPRSIFERLETLLWYHDEPVHSLTALIGFEIMRSARESGIKVMLSGQGADEPLAGYPNFFQTYWASLIRTGRPDLARREVGSWAAAHGGNAETEMDAARARARRIGWRLAFPPYGTVADAMRVRRMRKHPWFTPDFTSLGLRDRRPLFDSSLRDERAHSTNAHPLPVYLRIEDRNSMAHSVEGRVPFLDHRLVELAFGLPDDLLLRGPLNKFIQREAMRTRIPPVVQQRIDKMGFPHPRRAWFQEHLASATRELLADQSSKESSIFNTPRILADLERHVRGEIDCSADLFNVVQLEIWRRSLSSTSSAPASMSTKGQSSANVHKPVSATAGA